MTFVSGQALPSILAIEIMRFDGKVTHGKQVPPTVGCCTFKEKVIALRASPGDGRRVLPGRIFLSFPWIGNYKRSFPHKIVRSQTFITNCL
jgi:hypothetical protein